MPHIALTFRPRAVSLTAILICRLLLALQAANLKASSHGVEETWINESDTIRFATIELGSMGGPVASGPNSELFDVEEGSTAVGHLRTYVEAG